MNIMNIYLIIIVVVLIGEYLFDIFVESKNIKHASPELPREFAGYYDSEKYKTSQNYLVDNTRFSLVKGGVSTVLITAFILFGGFNAIDRMARGFGLGSIFTGLIFAGLLMLISQMISLPFSIYHTFVIEEKYGFNRTTVKTFILDIFKGWMLTLILGGTAFAGIVWFFERSGSFSWLYCWIAITVFQLFLTFLAPVIILPLFNKFIPLEDGELKSAIQDFARSQDFHLQGLFKMDASKRSTKSNAFFTGFGKFRRIALFDTLIERQTVEELVSVLAHEIGHYKKKHITKGILLSIGTTGLLFLLLSFFINNAGLFEAFRMQETSVYASLIFFGFLFSPIQFFLSIVTHRLSRKYEYEADAFAIETYKQPEAFINALKKLSVDNLSNLTPHPLKVFLEYSHPPVLERIKVIRESRIENGK